MRIKDPSVQNLDSILITDIKQIGIDPTGSGSKKKKAILMSKSKKS